MFRPAGIGLLSGGLLVLTRGGFLRNPDIRIAVDESRVDGHAREVPDAGVRRNRDRGADRDDRSVANDERSFLDHFAGGGDDSRVRKGVDAGCILMDADRRFYLAGTGGSEETNCRREYERENAGPAWLDATEHRDSCDE